MKSNKNLVYVIIGIIFVVMNIIVFAVPFNRDSSFWLGYAFLVISFLLAFGVVLYIAQSSRNMDEIFLKFPASYFAYGFIVIEIVLNLIVMAIPDFSIRVCIVFNIIIIAVFLILVIANIMSVNNTQNIEGNIKEKRAFVKMLLIDIQQCSMHTNNPVMARSIKALEELVRYSDPMSHDSLIPMEQEISGKIAQLDYCLKSGNENDAFAFIKEATDLINLRNQRCKVLK